MFHNLRKVLFSVKFNDDEKLIFRLFLTPTRIELNILFIWFNLCFNKRIGWHSKNFINSCLENMAPYTLPTGNTHPKNLTMLFARYVCFTVRVLRIFDSLTHPLTRDAHMHHAPSESLNPSLTKSHTHFLDNSLNFSLTHSVTRLITHSLSFYRLSMSFFTEIQVKLTHQPALLHIDSIT